MRSSTYGIFIFNIVFFYMPKITTDQFNRVEIVVNAYTFSIFM